VQVPYWSFTVLGATLQSLVTQVTWHLGSEQLRNREMSSSSKLLRFMNLITSCWWYGAIRQVSSNKTMSSTGHRCSDGKNLRSWTVLLAWKDDGTDKLPSLIIGKSENHHYLKNIMKLYAECVANRKAWVTHRSSLLIIWVTDAKMNSQKKDFTLLWTSVLLTGRTEVT
jgi:hypothetical protein